MFTLIHSLLTDILNDCAACYCVRYACAMWMCILPCRLVMLWVVNCACTGQCDGGPRRNRASSPAQDPGCRPHKVPWWQVNWWESVSSCKHFSLGFKCSVVTLTLFWLAWKMWFCAMVSVRPADCQYVANIENVKDAISIINASFSWW